MSHPTAEDFEIVPPLETPMRAFGYGYTRTMWAVKLKGIDSCFFHSTTKEECEERLACWLRHLWFPMIKEDGSRYE